MALNPTAEPPGLVRDTPPAPSIPAWLQHLLSIGLAVLLSILASKWNVVPTPIPFQPGPQVMVIHPYPSMTATATPCCCPESGAGGLKAEPKK